MDPSRSPAEDTSRLNYDRQIKYWRRILKTLLPNHYTSQDASRMSLGCFTISALELLGDLDAALSVEERRDYIDWVYECQILGGGFRPSPSLDFGHLRNDDNKVWDPAHVPGTFFALLVLILLGDDLTRVNRKDLLLWLTKMQRPDGSFGETLGENGYINGGSDSRFGYMAAAIRWILRGNLEGPLDGIPDVDVDKFVECVRAAETYDGGISEKPYGEGHAGFASCAIFALRFFDRLPLASAEPQDVNGRLRGISNLPKTLHWLAFKQTATIDEEDAFDTHGDETDSSATCHDSHSFVKLRSYPSVAGEQSFQGQPKSHFELQWVGLNGRPNKIADTCYAYWVCAPLDILGHIDIIDKKPIRRWLLDRTQHFVGGFGKLPDVPPDIYHSFLGLMTLSILGEPGLKSCDTALCISDRAKQHLESLPWRRELLGENGV